MPRFGLMVLLCTFAVGQASGPKRSTANSASTPAATPTPALPSLQTVEMFMHRMFGQDPTIKWRVASIAPSMIPGVAQVRVLVGEPPQPTNLYVMPDQRFAVVGDVLPFGADPFVSVRSRLKSDADGPSRGPADAAITIVEFADLQCPSCRAAHPVLERLSKDFPQSRFIFQHFPLANHKWAATAAAHAQCLHQQDPEAFWNYVGSVYEAQPSITETDADARLEQIAAGAGADVAKLTSCVKSPDTATRVQRSIDLGRAVGVTGTPSIYVNGRRIASVTDIPYESLKALIEFEARMAAK